MGRGEVGGEIGVPKAACRERHPNSRSQLTKPTHGANSRGQSPKSIEHALSPTCFATLLRLVDAARRLTSLDPLAVAVTFEPAPGGGPRGQVAMAAETPVGRHSKHSAASRVELSRLAPVLNELGRNRTLRWIATAFGRT